MGGGDSYFVLSRFLSLFLFCIGSPLPSLRRPFISPLFSVPVNETIEKDFFTGLSCFLSYHVLVDQCKKSQNVNNDSHLQGSGHVTVPPTSSADKKCYMGKSGT